MDSFCRFTFIEIYANFKSDNESKYRVILGQQCCEYLLEGDDELSQIEIIWNHTKSRLIYQKAFLSSELCRANVSFIHGNAITTSHLLSPIFQLLYCALLPCLIFTVDTSLFRSFPWETGGWASEREQTTKKTILVESIVGDIFDFFSMIFPSSSFAHQVSSKQATNAVNSYLKIN